MSENFSNFGCADELCNKLNDIRRGSTSEVIEKLDKYIDDVMLPSLEIIWINYDIKMASIRTELESIENKINYLNVSAPVPAITTSIAPAGNFNAPPGFNPPLIPGNVMKPSKPSSEPMNFKSELEEKVAKRKKQIGD
ncbi:MAG: hypothetical protein JW791_05250 [Nanoarchaeota archaeon]|nr:hypothetical protein [Nanoarchaeota archaeon]